MNIQKFTQKSMEAIQDCEKLAYEYGNQEIEQEHLLVALLQQEDGLILKLIEKMEIQKEHFVDNAIRHLEARTKVSGGQVYVGQALNKVLISAEDEAKQRGDCLLYTSVRRFIIYRLCFRQVLISSEALLIGFMWKVSVRYCSTFGLMKAGSVGPK